MKSNVELTGFMNTYAVELDGVSYTVIEMWDANTQTTSWEYLDPESDAVLSNEIEEQLREMVNKVNSFGFEKWAHSKGLLLDRDENGKYRSLETRAYADTWRNAQNDHR